MKSLLAALLAALMLPVALPGATAQEPFATHIADDTTGDVKVTSQGQGANPPADAYAAADLKALDILETPENFIFTLTVANLKPQAEAPFQGSTQYYVTFLQHDSIYRLHISRQSFVAAFYSARLEGFDAGRGGFYAVAAYDVVAEISSNTLAVTVPRQDLLDANGSAPHPETPVTGFHAATSGFSSITGNRPSKIGAAAAQPVIIQDFMPDSGNATTDLAIHFGAKQSGHARLSSETPTRASNGEATTFVFLVQASNLATHESTFTLSTTTIPQSWTVKLPSTQITIPGNGSVTLPVLVTTPFTHSHGSFQNFMVQMTDVADANSVGAVQLGIRYTQPPQPAGHHSEVWFHSEFTSDDPTSQQAFSTLGFGGNIYMNAEETDPIDDAVDVPGQNDGTAVNGTAPEQAFSWEVPLSPGLELGLDFDTTLRGHLQVNVKTQAPLPAAVLKGQLVYYAPPASQGNGPPADRGATTVLADLVPTAPQQLDNSKVWQLDADVVPRPEADFIPFQRGASMVLLLNLTTERADPPFPGSLSPAIASGSYMTLPLFEYHDPVNDIFISNVELVVGSQQDRFANPGQTVLFNLTVQNHGSADATFNLDLAGTNSEWAHILPADRAVMVPAGGSYAFNVVVKVPADVTVPTSAAVDKPAADLVVSATDQADPNQHALVRLYTTVDASTHKDDSAAVALLEEKEGAKAKTPGFEAAAALAALALAFVALRRKR